MNVLIDPGSAFGTGTHPSTRLCLEALERDPPDGLKVADLGCGSGILGLAALVYGARQVIAVVNDSCAVTSTNENLRLNDPVREVGATNFFSAYHGLNDRSIQTKIGELYKKICPSLTFNAPHTCDWMPGLEGGVPRIGFVSSFFYSHTIAKLYKELINGLPNGRFEVFSFSFSNFKDEWSSHFESGNSKFFRLPRDLARARQCIADAELDILYYTDIGMEPLTYFLAFARLAPIQCVSWGHPVTTGIKSIDYFISSKLIETEDSSQSLDEN